MPEPTDNRVAVYIDFDNIVISRYAQVHPKFRRDQLKDVTQARVDSEPELAQRLVDARIDIGAVLDYASSLGTVAVSRAYADWSIAVNAAYRSQLVNRAVDVVQMFPTVQSMKNGADIRLAVDVIEDLFTLNGLTHVVIVSGDSDYIALAQKTKRLGRYVVGVGVAGSVSASLASACDEFIRYEDLPGVEAASPVLAAVIKVDDEAAAVTAPLKQGQAKAAESVPLAMPKRGPAGLLAQALLLGHAKDDAEWLFSAAVKSQMRRIDPTFNEKELGFDSFSEFVNSRASFAELQGEGTKRMIRLRPAYRVKSVKTGPKVAS